MGIASPNRRSRHSFRPWVRSIYTSPLLQRPAIVRRTPRLRNPLAKSHAGPDGYERTSPARRVLERYAPRYALSLSDLCLRSGERRETRTCTWVNNREQRADTHSRRTNRQWVCPTRRTFFTRGALRSPPTAIASACIPVPAASLGASGLPRLLPPPSVQTLWPRYIRHSRGGRYRTRGV